MSLVLVLLSTLHDLEQDPNRPFSLSFLFCATGIIDPPCSRLRVGEGFVSSEALCTREAQASGWAGDTENRCPQHRVVPMESHRHQTPEPESSASDPGFPCQAQTLGTPLGTSVSPFVNGIMTVPASQGCWED